MVVVDVAPTCAAVIDDSHENLFAYHFAQVHDGRLHLFNASAAGLEDHFIGIGPNDFNAQSAAGAAADQEARVWVRHGKSDGGQSSLRSIASAFVCADPVPPLVAAHTIAAAHMNGVAFNGQILKRRTSSGPIREVA